MVKTFKSNKAGKVLMLESDDKKTRYEFYTKAVRKSNVDDTISYYEPHVRHCVNLGLGCTKSETIISVEDGNSLYLNLLHNGFHKVDFKSKSFA